MRNTLLLLGLIAGSGAATAATTKAPRACCAIVELRQYSLHPGRRDAFIPFFEREFIETQEAVGNTVIGQFVDLDNPERFTWLRGFPSLPERATALQAFYGGDVWKAQRAAANDYFTDTDNVLLLHAVSARAAFDLANDRRAPRGASAQPRGLVVATVYSFEAQVESAFVRFFERDVRSAIASAQIRLRGYYVSETAPNNFPRLPVREKDHVFVWFAMYADANAYDRQRARLEASPAWRRTIAPHLQRVVAATETLRLAPTPRSRLHD
jgi:hypothetical protein